MGSARQAAKRSEPKQERSRRTLRRLLAATEELLAERPLERITMRQILARSQVSAGSFYARFAGKDDLLQSIWEELRETIDEHLDQDLAGFETGTLADRVRFLISQRIQRYDRYRMLFRAFIVRLRLVAAPLSPEDRRAYQASQRRVIRFVMEARDEISHPHPELAITMAEFATAAAARELILFPEVPHAATVRLSRQAMIDELSQMFLAYLRHPLGGT